MWTRKVRSRPWIAPSQACRSTRANQSPRRTTTSAMEPRPCLRRWMWHTGEVIGRLKPRHRTQEFLEFLRTIDSNTPKDLNVHLIMDNYTTHKTQAVKDWLADHPRFHVHFTPTSASWLNLVERFFATLTEKWLMRQSHVSVKDLQDSIRHYLKIYNEDPKPFIWHKDADTILQSVGRAADALVGQEADNASS
nr:IS630 family transposase [Ectothiorhodospira haloalkaliphila]